MNNLNSSPSSFSGNIYHHNDDHDQLQLQPATGPNLQVASSSTCRIFISDQTQDQNRYYQEGANLSYNNNGSPSPSSHHHETMKNGTINIGLKLTLWKKEDHHDEPSDNINNGDTCDPLKWMSSKMRLMQKMKDPEYSLAPKRLRSDNHKLQTSSSSVDTDSSSNGSHHNNMNIMTNSPIRVCSDCNTTKTPLWRSGPKGPKSLCNACGIRQRKARRAMAAAAANGTVVPPHDRMKLKDKKIITSTGKINGHSSHLPKRCKVVNNRNADASKVESPTSKLEDFLIKLSKNLAFHRVFPQDEKDAAILLMALSSGLVHG